TISAPSVAPAPGLFSTITGCPRDLDNSSPSARARTSVVPPAENGTTKLTGLAGQDSAMAASDDMSPMAVTLNAAAASVRDFLAFVALDVFMILSPWFLSYVDGCDV